MGTLAVSILVLAVLMLLSAGPLPADPGAKDVFPEWQFMFRPEREALYYHVFAGTAFALQALAVFLLRRQLS